MDTINQLRKLAETQQFEQMLDLAQKYWEETQDELVLGLLAQAQCHMKQMPLAHKNVELAIQSITQLNPDSLIDLSAALILLQRVEQAISYLQQALAENQHHALGKARLGYCYLLKNQLEDAEQYFLASLEIDSSRVSVHNNLCLLYLQQSDYAKAQKVLDKIREQIKQKAVANQSSLEKQNQHLVDTMQLQVWVATQQFSQAEDWIALCQSKALREEHEQTNEDASPEYLIWVQEYARLLSEHDRHEQATELLKQHLKENKDNLDLLVQLSELSQLQGHFLPAMHLLDRALREHQDNISLWIQLSSVCLHRFDEKAKQAAQRAFELAQSLNEQGNEHDYSQEFVVLYQIQAKNALAQVASYEEDFETAGQYYREILQQNESFVPALQGLGQMLMQQGQIDEAISLFEQVKQIDPIRGHSSLINARRFPENEETLKQLEQAAKVPSMVGKLRSGILFQLASAWEKRKDYDKAMEMAHQANTASRQFLAYSATAHRNECAKVRQSFCKALYQHRPGIGHSSSMPIYVLGMPRSGTTLVEQIIAGHSKIFGAGELGLIPQIIQGLNRWERHVGSDRGYPDCVDDLTASVVEGIAENLLKELKEYAQDDKPEAEYIVDKLPHNFENIGLIKLLFPNAKIISVRRDPRDIALSNYFTDYQAKYGGMGFAYHLTTIGEQLADHNLLMHHWNQVFAGEILEIQYEEVVENPEAMARKMLDYIGVPWEAEVLNFYQLERTVKTASVWQVRQPIYKSSKAKWKNYQEHLDDLIKGTNAPIRPEPYEMISLPEAGWFTEAVELFKQDDLDGAEYKLKQLMHFIPEHAAANYILGQIYCRKGYLDEGLELIQKAVDKRPWQAEWRNTLAATYQHMGQPEKAAQVLKANCQDKNENAHLDEGQEP